MPCQALCVHPFAESSLTLCDVGICQMKGLAQGHIAGRAGNPTQASPRPHTIHPLEQVPFLISNVTKKTFTLSKDP